MLCGRPPFVDNWPLRVIMKQAFEAPLPPSRVRPDMPAAAAVDQFLGRALEKKAAARFQSASEMRAALQSFAGVAS
jgi:serine/threonine-protein kinase